MSNNDQDNEITLSAGKRPETRSSLERPTLGTIIDQIFFRKRKLRYLELRRAVFDRETTTFQLMALIRGDLSRMLYIYIRLFNPVGNVAIFVLNRKMKAFLGFPVDFPMTRREFKALREFTKHLGLPWDTLERKDKSRRRNASSQSLEI